MAIDKALGEALYEARARGVSWREVGQALGVAEQADAEQNVVDALADAKRQVWRRFWP